MDDDWSEYWLREFHRREAEMRAMGDAIRQQIMEQQAVFDRAVDEAHKLARLAAEQESMVQEAIDETFRVQVEMEERRRALLDALRMEDVFREQEHLRRVIEAVAESGSMMDAALSVVGTLQPPHVEALQWQRALEEARRQLDPTGAEIPEEADQNLVVQIMHLAWAVFGFLGRVHFALYFVSGGQYSLVPEWGTPDSAPPTVQEVVEVLESGPLHIATCRAVMRVEPSADADPVHRLDPGDTVRIYDAGEEHLWIPAICTETWYSGWVYTRHLRPR